MKNSFLTLHEARDEDVSKIFRPRRIDSRKGDNGVVAIVGGSRLYHGAPTLSAIAALRSGVDLVYVAVPQLISTAVRSISPNLIVIPLPDAKLTRGCVGKLLKWLPKVDVVVVGPGLGRQKPEGLQRLTREIAAKGVKILLDADALMPEVISEIKGRQAVLTPHSGEFKRLFGFELSSSLEEKAEKVKQMALDYRVTILLKGPVDVISDGNGILLNRSGSPAMTVGGTGDVLAGLVAGIMAKGVPPFEAAFAGAYVNGLAGELVAERLGFHILATDIIEELPYTLKKLEAGGSSRVVSDDSCDMRQE